MQLSSAAARSPIRFYKTLFTHVLLDTWFFISGKEMLGGSSEASCV